MKYKNFLLRAVNLLLILGVLWQYQQVALIRAAADKRSDGCKTDSPRRSPARVAPHRSRSDETVSCLTVPPSKVG